MMLVIFGAGMTFILIGQVQSTLWALRWAVSVLLGGLMAYNYAALGLPGSSEWVNASGFSAILIMVVIGMVFGFMAVLIWKRLPGRKM